MQKKAKIAGVDPPYAIPGGEIAVECEAFDAGAGAACFVGGIRCRIVAASSSRVMAEVPDDIGSEHTHVHLESGGVQSDPFPMVVGKLLVDGMHIVANPAVDPTDDALIVTRSGSRGQHLEATLYRLEPDGYVDELPEAILNPTGIAFNRDGQMFVTNRANGEVYLVDRNGSSTIYATGLGIATGIAFDAAGRMYVGDRAGTIYRVLDFADVETFAVIEPSVAAFHIAFGPDGRLYVTAPGLASHDAVYAIDADGTTSRYFRGLGRPQGLAFDKAGNLYVAGCYQGRHGIVKIAPEGNSAEHFVAGNNVVGLCFNRKGDLIVATGDSAYSLPVGIEGTLL